MSISPIGGSSNASAPSGAGMLHEGSRGPEVLELQQALVAAGFDPHGLDGWFGPKTEAAVLAFQRSRGLVVDGRVGAQTWGALRGAAAPAAPSPASAGMLQEGSRGASVVTLQKALQAAGFDPHGLDGWFGPKTRAAVTSFQRAMGIAANGQVGPETWAALRGSPSAPPAAPASSPSTQQLQQGAQGVLVEKLQTRLVRHGFRPGPVDGDFGPMTRAAVVAFQAAKGLPATGVVDAATWGALNAAPAAPVSPSVPADRAQAVQQLLDWAQGWVGVAKYAAVDPFRYGEVKWDGRPHTSQNGSGTVYNYPAGTTVFDCSGFVIGAYRQLGVDLLAHGLSGSQAMGADTSFLQPLSTGELAPGDLVVYGKENGIGHVVIYLGDGKCIECAGGAGVTVRDVDWSRVASCRRVPLGA